MEDDKLKIITDSKLTKAVSQSGWPQESEPTLMFRPNPNVVGGYQMGGQFGISFNLVERPNWLHRFGVRIVLGWIWKDSD